MKVVTAAQMRQVDQQTITEGIPGLILMENAGHCVVEVLEKEFAPLASQRIVVLCGKGNNGGDGLVIARQLFTRIRPAFLEVVLFADPAELKGDAQANLKMLEVCGCPLQTSLSPESRTATLVIDALLGTGITGEATGRALEAIQAINRNFPLARVAAVDIPSGLPSDSADATGEFARADVTVTFTGPKIAHALPPNCDRMGRLYVGRIGSPERMFEGDPAMWLSLVTPEGFRELLSPRKRSGHKGDYGHALIIGGAEGKAGAAAMSGLAALRAGAGLVTVSCSVADLASIAPELMTEPLARPDMLGALVLRKDVVAIGPGLGVTSGAEALVRRAYLSLEQPMIVDADGLNVLSSGEWPASESLRVLTPHPGEMSRLSGAGIREILNDRVNIARRFAIERSVVLVLKGQRTLIAFPDGRVWINPTGSPAMATGGSGDILTGLIAGFLAQFPERPEQAIAGAVYLHGLAGEIGARAKGEMPLLATDLLTYLPEAIHACYTN